MNSSRTRKTRLQKNPTVQDVARLAGVSTATVSRVMADFEAVSDDARQRVLEAVKSLNYQLNRNARNLRRSTTSKIGVIISDIQNPFFGSVVRGIEKVTVEGEYTIVLGNSDENPERERRLIAMLLEEGVAGIVFVPTNVDSDSYNEFFDSGTPFVVIDRKVKRSDLDLIVVDGCTGSQLAVEELISLGHVHIGFIGGLPHLSVMQERENGYLETLRRHSLPLEPEYLRHANNRQDGGYQAMKELLAMKAPPSAVLIANNLMTLGGLMAIHESGVQIPEEVSLIGFDDMDWASSLQPPLTVVAQPAFEMGERAAAVLLARIHSPQRPVETIVLQTKLILRSSCRSLPAGKELTHAQ